LREIPPRYFKALRVEETSDTVPACAVRLVAEFVAAERFVLVVRPPEA